VKNRSASETQILSDLAEKYPETQTTSKNPDLVENPKNPFLGPAVLNQLQIKVLSISQEVIELES